MFFIIWFLYLLLLFASIRCVYLINVKNLDFSSGLLIGSIFFLAAPMLVILLSGSQFSSQVITNIYDPIRDYVTTINLFIGWFMVLIIFLIFNRNNSHEKISKYELNELVFVKSMFFIYLIITVYSSYTSGVFASGGHWHESVGNTMRSNSIFIILKNFSQVYRTVLFGGLLYLYFYKKINLRQALFYGCILVAIDLASTFNRITLVYLFIMGLLIYRKKAWQLISLTIILFPFLTIFSQSLTIFRASFQGLSGESIKRALELAGNADQSLSQNLVERINPIFESTNILVFDYLIKNIYINFDLLYGKTFFIRPLTTFIPSTIWQDKPSAFGVYLGDSIAGGNIALNSTLFGESLGNFGFYWPIFFFLFFLITTYVFNAFSKIFSISRFMSLYIGIAIWRFDFNFIIVSIYSFIAAYIFYSFVMILRNAYRSN